MTTRTDRTTDRPGADASSPTEVPAPGWRQIVVRAFKEQGDDNVGMMAGAVAYFAFLALFPALIASISIWALVAGDPDTLVDQASGVVSQLPEDAAGVVENQLQSIGASATGALSFGVVVTILLALWSASGGMSNMIKALNIAYDEEDGRGFLKGRALALALTLGAIVFVLIALGLVAVLPVVLNVVDLGPAATVAVQVLRFVVLAGVILVALAVLYRLAPHRDDPQFQWVSIGAGFATVMLILASIAFSFYVDNFGSYNETYGTLASAAILLLYLYITAFIILFGAEINAEAERQTRRDTTQGEEQPMGERDAHAADTEPGAPGRRTGDDS